MGRLEASCRVALAGLLHDLGKVTQRAKIFDSDDRMDYLIQHYCPWHGIEEKSRYPSHKHAAGTARAFDEIEKNMPDILKKDMSPFSSRKDTEKDITDCLSNAAAMHHRPETFLQWCVAKADRVASGFERDEFEDYNKARDAYITEQLEPLLELACPKGEEKNISCTHVHPLKPMTSKLEDWFFPDSKAKRIENEAVPEYEVLWNTLLDGLKDIPESHRSSWPVWMDHFDSLWLTVAHSVPSSAYKVYPRVSLYDHSKTVAALAVALWRWHEEEGEKTAAAVKGEDEKEKFLLLQGDFFGIQEFIFGGRGDSTKDIAKSLRGRSFLVSLLCECAALKVLEALELPPTSQILNAAGKFLIVAPNTASVRDKLKAIQREFDDWFKQESFGLSGIGVASCPASPADFRHKKFEDLKKRLFDKLETLKLQRFDLCGIEPDMPLLKADYSHGACGHDKRFPAEELAEDGKRLSRLAMDQIRIGGKLAQRKNSRILIFHDDVTDVSELLTTSFFGYRVLIAKDEAARGKFGSFVDSGSLRRVFDFSIPDEQKNKFWNGYARRNINAHIATEDGQRPKDFGELAQGDAKGIEALGVLKGDVDNLGALFQDNTKTFAEWASFSRQMHAFFSLWLPHLCRREFPDVYTVFAGGDDFFMLGPWKTMQNFAGRMREDFTKYCANNPHLHFSAGYVMVKPGLTVPLLEREAERALEKAKEYKDKESKRLKNAITISNQTISWEEWPALQQAEKQLADCDKHGLSTGYLYSLLELAEMAENDNDPKNAMWRARFYYRTRRYVTDKLPENLRKDALNELSETLGKNGLEMWGRRYRIPLSNFLYQQRNGDTE